MKSFAVGTRLRFRKGGMIAELLSACIEAIFEFVAQCFVELFVEGSAAICRMGQEKVNDYREQKEEQEYQASLPNRSLLRAAHPPASSHSEELLRPASGTTPTAATELLRASQETPHEFEPH